MIVRVEVIADIPEIIAEEPVEHKTVGRMAIFFKNLLSKKKKEIDAQHKAK